MPRKPKTSVETNPGETVGTADNGKATAAEPKKKTRPAAVPAKKKKAAAPKKPAAKRPVAAASKRTVEPSDDEIRLRAYFIAERRHKLSLPGDSNHDWIEARRQLIEEAQRSAT